MEKGLKTFFAIASALVRAQLTFLLILESENSLGMIFIQQSIDA